MRACKTVAAAAMGLALVACGGGGGGGDGGDTPEGPQAATAGITSTNFSATADGAAAATTGTFLGFFTGTGTVSSFSASRATAASAGAPRTAMTRLLSRDRASGRAQALAVTQKTEPCDSGSLLVTIDDADGNLETASAGDSVSFTSQNCVFDSVPVLGSFKLTVQSYSEGSTSISSAFVIDFNGFGSPELFFDGRVAGNLTDGAAGFTLRLVHQGLTVDGPAIEPVQWWHTVNYAQDYNTLDEVASFSGFVGVNGGFVELDQVADFLLSGTDPTEGELRVNGSNGGRVHIVAGATGFEYEFYQSGNNGSTPDATASGLAY